ncbi:MAG TPA: hypothetical protein VF158_09090 [Longimicrobiales bacterium]
MSTNEQTTPAADPIAAFYPPAPEAADDHHYALACWRHARHLAADAPRTGDFDKWLGKNVRDEGELARPDFRAVLWRRAHLEHDLRDEARAAEAAERIYQIARGEGLSEAEAAERRAHSAKLREAAIAAL